MTPPVTLGGDGENVNDKQLGVNVDWQYQYLGYVLYVCEVMNLHTPFSAKLRVAMCCGLGAWLQLSHCVLFCLVRPCLLPAAESLTVEIFVYALLCTRPKRMLYGDTATPLDSLFWPGFMSFQVC